MNNHSTLPPSLAVANHTTGDARSIAVLRLCRPQKRNALDDATIAGVDQFFATLPTDTAAVVIHGEGAHFCAGLDLNTITDSDATEGLYRSRAWHRAFDQIAGADVPVMEVAASAAQTANLPTFAVLHALPRIAEADPNIGGLMKSLTAALAAGDEEARVRVRAFLEGRAAKLAPKA